MSDTTFVQGTIVTSDWLNSINDFFYTLFQGSVTAQQARDALGIGDGEADITVNNLTVNGDTILGDTVDGASTTVNLGDSDSFTINNQDGDTIFQINEDGTAEYPDGQILIEDLSEEVINLIFSSGGSGSSSGGNNTIASGDGRLSLASGTRVMTRDYTGVTTIYYVGGLLLFFNDGSGSFSPFTIGELSQTLASSTFSPSASAANSNYDIFGWKNTLSITGITRSGTTATATTSAAHNITTDAVVYISGANQAGYNGYQTLTGGSGSTFTFEVSGSPTTPATGTITAATARISRGPAWRNAGQAITGATNATPIVITAASHGLSTGDSVEVTNVVGNTAANGVWTITVVNGNSFSLNTSVGNGAYVTSGAFAARGVGASTTQIELVGSTYVNTVAITNGPSAQQGTYLGTIRTNASNQLDWKLGSAAAGGGEAWFSVWNVSNRVDFAPTVLDSNTSWTYGASAARPMDNSTTNRISFVRGLNDDPAEFTVISEVRPTQGLAGGNLVALDSITEQAANSQGTWGARTPATEVDFPILARYAGLPGLGFHFSQALEYQGAPAIGSCEWFGRSTVYTLVPLYTTAFFGSISA